MIDTYFDTYVANAIDEINKFSDKQLSYGALNTSKRNKAFKIIEQSFIGKADADHVDVLLNSESQNVICKYICPTNPGENKDHIIRGSEFSANPLIAFLNDVFS